MTFNYIDIIFFIIICIFVLRGLHNGLIKEVASIAALVVGILFAYLFFQPVAAKLMEWGVKVLAPVLGFVIVFCITYVLIRIMGEVLQTIVAKAFLSSLDKILGGALGFLEGFLIVYILLTLITLQPFEPLKNVLNQSLSKNIIDNNLYSLTAYFDRVYEQIVESVSTVANQEPPGDV